MSNKNLPPSQQVIFGNDPETHKNNREIIIEKALDGLYTKKNIEMITDLHDKLITKITQVRMFADAFSSKPAAQLVEYLSIYKISKDRQGRKERVDIMKQFMNADEMDDKQGIFDRFIKGKG